MTAQGKARGDELMREHHYLSFAWMAGEFLRHVALLEGEWVALPGWDSSDLKGTLRNRFITLLPPRLPGLPDHADRHPDTGTTSTETVYGITSHTPAYILVWHQGHWWTLQHPPLLQGCHLRRRQVGLPESRDLPSETDRPNTGPEDRLPHDHARHEPQMEDALFHPRPLSDLRLDS